ncbi:MAG TPA: AI-2E family transporter [Candidatus Blautia pullicola]|mgnify:FL=1|uniref:AI-2E family transporter n=1 Tax=Candidatus Blautia pullicola TaxID=2838498 RepID=A0A9D2FSY3_9FIRM|nr:AI-2E family transporter [Candidatus Blautia pullicola]
MKWRQWLLMAAVTAGVLLGVKYALPVMLPFIFGWILAEAVYPFAAFLGERKVARKLHFTSAGIGAGIILALTVACIGLILSGAEYITGKVGECIRYLPQVKEEAVKVIERCCSGAEQLTGISAKKSSVYVYEQVERLGTHLLDSTMDMNRAVDGVKGCFLVVGVLIVAIVSAILFLQERQKVRRLLDSSRFLGKIKHLGAGLWTGGKAYLRAQIKIMGIISLVCIVGLWLLRVKHFLGFGLAVGILDAFPVLGTGTFLIPAGIFLLLSGETAVGVGYFLLYLVTAAIRQLLEPRLIGEGMGISPLAVLLSVYLGLFFYGGWGFLLGPLSGLLLYGIFKEWDFHKFL